MAKAAVAPAGARAGQGVDWPLALFVALGAALATYAPAACDSTGACGQWAGTKPYKQFEEFFAFYMTQHADQTCRRLHFVGTSLVVANVMFDVNAGISILAASLFGLATMAATRSLSSGLVEAGVYIAVLFAVNYRLTKSIRKPLAMLFLGYGFAWVGHFVFEKNRPATFVYPVYSLASDVRLWAEIVSRSRPF